jgi:hypothetical protein
MRIYISRKKIRALLNEAFLEGKNDTSEKCFKEWLSKEETKWK